MRWLYFVPNLLVIQQLETLYLDGNNVRIVCARVWKINQECARRAFFFFFFLFFLFSYNWNSWLTCEWWLARIQAHMWSMQEVEGLVQQDHYRTKSKVWPFCYLATRTHNLSQSWVSRQSPLFCRKWLFTFLHIPYYKYTYTHEI